MFALEDRRTSENEGHPYRTRCWAGETQKRGVQSWVCAEQIHSAIFECLGLHPCAPYYDAI